MGKELYGLKLLVVDDAMDTRELLDGVLRRAGAEVVAVGSAHEALAELLDTRFHLLISDIAMPDEDGYSLLKKVRALPPERGGRMLFVMEAQGGRGDAVAIRFEFFLQALQRPWSAECAVDHDHGRFPAHARFLKAAITAL